MVAAFEQSLSTMTNRLQDLTNSSDLKDCELDRLRRTIETLKQHGGALVQGVEKNNLQQRSASIGGGSSTTVTSPSNIHASTFLTTQTLSNNNFNSPNDSGYQRVVPIVSRSLARNKTNANTSLSRFSASSNSLTQFGNTFFFLCMHPPLFYLFLGFSKLLSSEF